MRVTPPREYGLGTAACVAVGLSVGFDFELVGRIVVSEPVIFVLLFAAAATGRIPPLTWPTPALLALTVVWLLAQITSDVINDNVIDNMARGLARSGMTAILLLGFHALLADRIRNIWTLYVSLAIGLLLGAAFNPSEYFEDYVWKFGYGNGATMLMIGGAAVLWRLDRPMMGVAVCAAAGGLNLYLGYRSMAGAAAMTGLLCALSLLFDRTSMRSLGGWRVWIMLLVLSAGGAGVIEAYARMAQMGALGDVERDKYLTQVDERGVLLSGRAEFPVALEAVLERPLFGHGSWAVNEYYSILYWGRANISVEDIPVDTADTIPTHSHLMGSWVEGGFFAALFWIYVSVLLVRAVAVVTRNVSLADPLLVFTMFNFGWALLFSPYGLGSRVTSCFAVVVIAFILKADAARNAGEAPVR